MALNKNKKVTEYVRVINEAKEYFESLEEKQQDSYDSKSDSWKDSEKGDEFQEELDYLGDLNVALNDAVDILDSLYEEI